MYLYRLSTGLKTHTNLPHLLQYRSTFTSAPRYAQDALMSKSEALLQKAEKRQPQSTLPVSNNAISADEVLALRCMARDRQARPLALALTAHHHRGRHDPHTPSSS